MYQGSSTKLTHLILIIKKLKERIKPMSYKMSPSSYIIFFMTVQKQKPVSFKNVFDRSDISKMAA